MDHLAVICNPLEKHLQYGKYNIGNCEPQIDLYGIIILMFVFIYLVKKFHFYKQVSEDLPSGLGSDSTSLAAS